MNNKYFNWLCDVINPEEKKYNHLLEALYCVKFHPLVPNDDNREEDGKKLREEFIDSYSDLNDFDVESFQDYDCTVLEMMIALARRLEFETSQSRWEKTPSEWFWILIDNLGLSEMDDSQYLNFDVRNRVRSIIYNLVDRKYGTDGEGGLFPLKYPKHDQTKVEIWYQMTEYLMENYPI